MIFTFSYYFGKKTKLRRPIDNPDVDIHTVLQHNKSQGHVTSFALIGWTTFNRVNTGKRILDNVMFRIANRQPTLLAASRTHARGRTPSFRPITFLKCSTQLNSTQLESRVGLSCVALIDLH